ncbi:hypothetical protein DSY14_05665 [Nocardiopsis sp. MG754419]|nr:hypothetical protein [Nocardiopsis sp. MG754419]
MLAALFMVLPVGCSRDEGVSEPTTEPTADATAAADPGDFEALSGAEIPDSAESVDIFSVGDADTFPTYVATFTLPDEEEAAAFCASGDIGNYRAVSAGALTEEEHERHFIGDAELIDPIRCTSVKQGENVDRSAVFSFPEGERVSVWAVTEEIGW